jgi:hypothetical protein
VLFSATWIPVNKLDAQELRTSIQNRKGGTNKKDAGTTGAYLQSFPRLKIRLPLPKAFGYLIFIYSSCIISFIAAVCKN